ncbi:MAG: N-acetylmuramoyl-L-alanine amidase family protein [Clostridium sp.]
MARIVIDAGHGGNDSGAYGCGIEEKNKALSVAQKIKELAEQRGIEVYLTRSSDRYISLDERANVANNVGADIFVSIHLNSSDSIASGVETFVYNNCSDKSKTLANLVQANMVNDFGINDRGVKSANFAVLRLTKMPAILTEGGFINNANDMAKVTIDGYANAVTKGICEYFGIPYKKEDNEVFYRVCVTSCKDIENAKKELERVKSLGFPDSFIAKYEVE